MLDDTIRRLGLGGSEIAAVAGLNPYSTAAEVWARKTGRLADKPETLPMRLGTYLETFNAQLYANRSGFALKRGATCQSAQVPWMVGTPDFYVLDDEGRTTHGLECKWVTYFDAEDWGPSGTDIVPVWYIAQIQHYMELTGLRRWDLAALGPREHRWYVLFYDAELVSMLRESGEYFWYTYVVGDVEPPLEVSEAVAEYLARRYGQQNGDRLVVPDAMGRDYVQSYIEIAQDLKAFEEDQLKAKSYLQSLIGEAAGLQVEGFQCTWKQDKPRKEVDWQAVALASGATPEIIAKFTEEKPGSRRFICRAVKGKR
jgi:putative phage-type endonuclease